MRNIRVAIIGAGPGGICMGIQLQQAGFSNFEIFESGEGVGGTWRRNTYPGCACDIPSLVYQFSFELNPGWSRPYGTQSEILAYMERCAEKYGLLRHCRFGSTVERATWQEHRSGWELELSGGETVEVDIVVSAVGMFGDLVWPDIPGLTSFGGTLFHSARWDWGHDLAAESVAVIGSAASAVQLVPEIVHEAGQVYLFQRTANWVLPKPDRPYSDEELAAFRADPAELQRARQEIFAMQELNSVGGADAEARATREAIVLDAIQVVEDPVTRAKLVPQHPWGCKRPLLSNDFYPAFNRPNLELVTDAIAGITENSVTTADGVERRVDTVILATGYETTKYVSAIDVVGRDGIKISTAWQDGAQAYLGVATAGFPNLFMLYGPNTNSGSIITMIEFQVEHIVGQLRRMSEEGLAWIEVLPECMQSYNEEVQRAIAGVEHWQAGCNGYYRSPSGRVVTQWPHTMGEFRDRVVVPRPEDFAACAVRSER